MHSNQMLHVIWAIIKKWRWRVKQLNRNLEKNLNKNTNKLLNAGMGERSLAQNQVFTSNVNL